MAETIDYPLRAKATVEFIGTYFLVLAIGMAAVPPGAGEFTPLVFTSVLVAMIYAGGPISKAHYNPAVTLAFFLRGAFPARHAPAYVGAQLAGAASAAFSVSLLKDGATAEPIECVTMPTLVAEGLFTFALCFVILCVATMRVSAGNQYYGLAIGGVVLGGAYAVGSISAAAFNPAVNLALGMFEVVRWQDLWMHLVAQISGAIAATLVCNRIDPRPE